MPAECITPATVDVSLLVAYVRQINLILSAAGFAPQLELVTQQTLYLHVTQYQLCIEGAEQTPPLDANTMYHVLFGLLSLACALDTPPRL